MSKLPIVALSLLTPLLAQAVNCVEYLQNPGTTQFVPVVNELTNQEMQRVTAVTLREKPSVKLVSAKPRLKVRNEVIIATFPNLGNDGFIVYGLQGPRGYARPDVHEIEGFLKRQAKEAPREDLVTTSGMIPTRVRMLLYGRPNAMRTIQLESNEVISAVMNFGPERRVVITSRPNDRIGFSARRTEFPSNQMIEIYVLEPTGHSVLGLRVPTGKSAYPKIKVIQLAGKDLLLGINDQTFRLDLVKSTAFATR